MMNFGFTEILLVGLAVTLVAIAIIDVRTFTISNRVNVGIAALAPLYWWSIGLPLWPDAAMQIGVALAVFVVLAATFYIGMMGGGDVKLAAALALWFSPTSTIRFLIVMSIAGGLLTLFIVVRHRWRRDTTTEGQKPEVPYGVAIAVGGLWILAQRFLNQFA